MGKSKFSERQVTQALSQLRAGTPMSKICRELAITRATLYRWRKQRDGSAPSAAVEMRELREENQRLREIVANFLLDRLPLRRAVPKPV
jgi:putative transposase